jgi:hypothetical protein
MAFTDFSDIYAAVHENGFNYILNHIQRQRPSLFNYGTQSYLDNIELFCRRIPTTKDVIKNSNPIATLEEPIPIAGTNSVVGLEYCFQIVKIIMDFHPNNTIQLPPELKSEYKEQTISLALEICASVICPDQKISEKLGDHIARTQKPIETNKKEYEEVPRPPIKPIPGIRLECFCLEIIALLSFEKIIVDGIDYLTLRLDNLEIVDLKPENLENSIECYIKTALRIGILPKIKIALRHIIGEIDVVGELAVELMAPTPQITFNPSVSNDLLQVYVNLEVSP